MTDPHRLDELLQEALIFLTDPEARRRFGGDATLSACDSLVDALEELGLESDRLFELRQAIEWAGEREEQRLAVSLN